MPKHEDRINELLDVLPESNHKTKLLEYIFSEEWNYARIVLEDMNSRTKDNVLRELEDLVTDNC